MIRVRLVPVLFASGIGFFDKPNDVPIMLEHPSVVGRLPVTPPQCRIPVPYRGVMRISEVVEGPLARVDGLVDVRFGVGQGDEGCLELGGGDVLPLLEEAVEEAAERL